MRAIIFVCVMNLGCSLRAAVAEFPTFQPQEIDPLAGKICYAVTVADVNGDDKPDVVAVTEDAVVWYANPSWRKQDPIMYCTKLRSSLASAAESTRRKARKAASKSPERYRLCA